MKKILLALSLTQQTQEGVNLAIELAGKKGAKLYVLFVLDSNVPDTIFEKLTDIGFIGEKPSSELRSAVAKQYRGEAEKQLDDIAKSAVRMNVECDVLLEEGDFTEKTLEAVAKFAVDMLVLTRTRRSALSKLFMGSGVDRLLRQAPCEIKIFED